MSSGMNVINYENVGEKLIERRRVDDVTEQVSISIPFVIILKCDVFCHTLLHHKMP